MDDMRINPEAGVIDEDAPVHFSHIDASNVTFGDRPHRTLEIKRQVQVLGKVIERPERQYAQRFFVAATSAATVLTVPSPPAATIVS